MTAPAAPGSHRTSTEHGPAGRRRDTRARPGRLRHRRRRRRHIVHDVDLQLHASTTSTPTTSTTAQATNPNTYDLSAQANAVDLLLAIPNLPLGLSIEAGPSGSSASLNSLGRSLSDAGAPYAPTIASLPGTVNRLGSGSPSTPTSAGYVSASYPRTPTDAQTQGGSGSPRRRHRATPGCRRHRVQLTGSTNATFQLLRGQSERRRQRQRERLGRRRRLLLRTAVRHRQRVVIAVDDPAANGQPKVTAETELGTITLLGQATGLLGKGVACSAPGSH